ncbi:MULTISPECIES: hypothetical protein [Natrialbaceae]|uniref:hypothetical protein n=1 Tax=Natrialbaceae TaxID=1644061 RepID=UPI00207D0DC1|nr:hypothetical protein [Natronococcus sp. CG52]
MNRVTAVALAFIVTTATLSVAAVGAGASAASSSQTVDAQSESDAYAGTYVTFEASGNALTDYRVDGEPVFENVSVDAQSDHQSEVGAGADVSLAAVTSLSGTGLQLDARSETRAEVSTDGSASINAHDTERGILTVHAGEESQYVELELAGESNAEADGDDRIVVESDDRTGVFVVGGDGDVTVNDQGDVTAELESESTLVFRSYGDGERDDDAQAQEELIADGTATAEVYVDERDGDRVADVATYGQDIAVETHEQSEERLEMTVERTRSEGTVVITSVSEGAIEAAETAEDLEVTIDGEAAAEASSFDELEGGIGEEPRYMVSQSGEASAAADVLVAVNHFSEREVAIQDDSSADAGDDADSVPGFGTLAALVAALVAAASRVR